MKIGIIGKGVIGTANSNGFIHLGHDVFVHDPKLGTDIQVVIDTEIIFICVPTPTLENGKCDISIVETVLQQLDAASYQGMIAIRSTIIPGSTKKLQTQFSNLEIAYVPEFLRERSATEDFIENHTVLAIGSENPTTVDKIIKCHGDLPQNIEILTPTEAEILKYYNNVFASLRIIFANNIFEICVKLGADYNKVKNTYVKTGKLGNMYLDVNENLRGYAGPCLPKDTLALANLMREKGINFGLIEQIHQDNAKLKKTVLPGMRIK